MAEGQVRIIGGVWRGRKIRVPDLPDLRPTPDRVRETLFNWLQPIINGSRCLDLFAGSGALGFEALSRGASFVEMIDQSAKVVSSLQNELKILGATNAKIYAATVPAQLVKPMQPFHIVFLDPPFKESLLAPCCAYLEENHFLADEAYIYLEAKSAITQDVLPHNWELLKTKKAGQVFYHLAKRIKEGKLL